MIFAIRQADDAQIAALLEDPEQVIDFIYGPDTGMPRSRNLLLRRNHVRRIPAEPLPPSPPPPAPVEPNEMIDIDKAWHGIHFLLTGTAWEGEGPLGFILNDGLPIGDIDVGYGPARAFSAAETQAIGQALEAVSPATLRAAYDPGKFAAMEIYPDIWDDEDDAEENITYLLEHFIAMRQFILHLAARRSGMIVFLF
ncbi:MAG: YfbM family protein, partial [Victivallales bacterium]|nr:YfbM family protein [Victivallales bacterium]